MKTLKANTSYEKMKAKTSYEKHEENGFTKSNQKLGIISPSLRRYGIDFYAAEERSVLRNRGGNNFWAKVGEKMKAKTVNEKIKAKTS